MLPFCVDGPASDLPPADGCGTVGSMSNVISLEDHPKAQATGWASARERDAIAAELTHLMDRIRAAAARIAALSGEPIQVQQTAQCLLDAITAMERAADRLTADPGTAPSGGNSEM
jgi:hypothetical protein